ncbi:MAG: hypothetical protein COT91_00605 [Candidatus Doudnabacteria bacterium CG10_big_fil_rev_8_21_14_0_10_41_10]|uniref:Uncharacterized protein n=1 Tax=Candidatus Doudnabacteria bacterium CG10_big_fil_rev_8_21_14_0_10_41_10 TaxID=1974551 RepID=A0A2H0VEV5_9BACT|nr:MAG: hypothetical protein COT91_00605 [Candidatus Doudnabacteria bacterium CG10_big_fil_rev_8_21_14_0_10_41_10]
MAEARQKPSNRKLQARGSRLARPAFRRGKVGDQIVRKLGRKKQLAILHFGKRIFLIIQVLWI